MTCADCASGSSFLASYCAGAPGSPIGFIAALTWHKFVFLALLAVRCRSHTGSAGQCQGDKSRVNALLLRVPFVFLLKHRRIRGRASNALAQDLCKIPTSASLSRCSNSQRGQEGNRTTVNAAVARYYLNSSEVYQGGR